MAIKNTHNTTNVSNVDHKEQSPIIIKNDSVHRTIYNFQRGKNNFFGQSVYGISEKIFLYEIF